MSKSIVLYDFPNQECCWEPKVEYSPYENIINISMDGVVELNAQQVEDLIKALRRGQEMQGVVQMKANIKHS